MKAKVALGLGGRNTAEIKQLTQNILTEMTGNPHFGEPSPTLEEVQAKLTALNTKVNAYEAAADAVKTALAERDTTEAELCNLLTNLGTYVDNVSNGDAAIIHSAGMPVRATPTPIEVGQVENLSLRASLQDGELIARWKKVKGNLMYRVQISTDGINWVDKLDTSKCKCKLNHDLVSGIKVWVRVCAQSAGSSGPWSLAVSKIVP